MTKESIMHNRYIIVLPSHDMNQIELNQDRLRTFCDELRMAKLFKNKVDIKFYKGAVKSQRAFLKDLKFTTKARA